MGHTHTHPSSAEEEREEGGGRSSFTTQAGVMGAFVKDAVHSIAVTDHHRHFKASSISTAPPFKKAFMRKHVFLFYHFKICTRQPAADQPDVSLITARGVNKQLPVQSGSV